MNNFKDSTNGQPLFARPLFLCTFDYFPGNDANSWLELLSYKFEQLFELLFFWSRLLNFLLHLSMIHMFIQRKCN